MIDRKIENRLKYLTTKFPVLFLTGPRQSGKSTLLRNVFSDYKYVSLEEPDIRLMAESDPRGFLENYRDKTIIDEAQYVPQLFSYIQSTVDRDNHLGMYILSGSQNFLLMQQITQSLAGRAAVLKLLPFSYQELDSALLAPETIDKMMFTGGYPRIYDKQIAPVDFYPNYIQTYIERDVRLLKNVKDLSLFIKFLRLCAGRTGQLLNVSALSNESGINVATVQSWISVLEASYVLFLLKPYYKNYNKRLTKSSKLYFYDTGLTCSLLGINQYEQLATHYLRGELFENWVISEYLKKCYSLAQQPEIYFWRDSNANEVDLLIEKNNSIEAVEIKSGSTMNSSYFKGLNVFRKLSDIPVDSCKVVYTGESSYTTTNGIFVPWKEW